MKKSWAGAAGAVLLAAALLSACGGSSDNSADANATPAAANGSVKEFTIHAKNFAFDLTEIKVSKGDTVKITLDDTEGPHAVKFDHYGSELKTGKTITFVADQAGTFDYACSVICGTGHSQMKGKLIVE